MDNLPAHIQKEVPWCMLLAKDIVLVDESRNGVNAKLEIWQKAFESKGFKIIRTKTEHMNCNFSGDVQRDIVPMRIEAQKIQKRVLPIPWLYK